MAVCVVEETLVHVNGAYCMLCSDDDGGYFLACQDSPYAYDMSLPGVIDVEVGFAVVDVNSIGSHRVADGYYLFLVRSSMPATVFHGIVGGVGGAHYVFRLHLHDDAFIQYRWRPFIESLGRMTLFHFDGPVDRSILDEYVLLDSMAWLARNVCFDYISLYRVYGGSGQSFYAAVPGLRGFVVRGESLEDVIGTLEGRVPSKRDLEAARRLAEVELLW